MQVSNKEFRPYVDRRSEAEYMAVRAAVAAHTDAGEQKERSPLGFVLAVAISLMCWAGLALLVL